MKKVKDLTNIVHALAVSGEVVKTDPTFIPFLSASANTQAYINQQNMDEQSLETCIKENNIQLYELFFAKKDNDGNALFYSPCSESNKKSTRDQRVQLFNNIMKIYVIKVRNKRDNNPLQASTTNSFLRRFFAHIKMKYNIVMSLKDDFSFPGGLTGEFSFWFFTPFFCALLCTNMHDTSFVHDYLGTLTHLYAIRAKQNEGYGVATGKQKVAAKDNNIWERAVNTLNQDDATEMSMLILILCGSFFALRGCQEHADLSLSNVEIDDYPPGSDFQGYKFIGLTNLVDKSHKLR